MSRINKIMKHNDKICLLTLFETWYKCSEHNVPYPKGAKCPKCEKDKIMKEEKKVI